MEYRFYKVKNTIISLLLISVEVIFVNSASSAGKRYLATLMWQKKEKKNRSHFYFEPSPKYFGLAVGLSHFLFPLRRRFGKERKGRFAILRLLIQDYAVAAITKKKKGFSGVIDHVFFTFSWLESKWWLVRLVNMERVCGWDLRGESAD